MAQETSLSSVIRVSAVSLKHTAMALFSLRVLLIGIIFRVCSQSVLQRTLTSVFVDPKKSNLTCVLPTVSQQMQCLKEPGLQGILHTANQLASETCKTNFQYELWNCVTPTKTAFEIVNRETAFLYALYTAALAYAVSQACARGVLMSCHCAIDSNNPDSQMLTAGLCPDNTIFGIQFTKSFLHIRKKDPYLDLEHHNAKIGLKVIKDSLEEKCSCYGLLRSCHVKFCYKMLKTFSAVVKSLKLYYHSAVLWNRPNSVRPVLKRRFARSILYTATSALDCNTTGRACLHRSHCTALCCGRGFYTHSHLVYWYCRCSWAALLSLQCDICHTQRFTYTCK